MTYIKYVFKENISISQQNIASMHIFEPVLIFFNKFVKGEILWLQWHESPIIITTNYCRALALSVLSWIKHLVIYLIEIK